MMKLVFNKYLMLIILSCLPGLMLAQKVMIRGVVSSDGDNLPLPAAHVILQNADERVIASTITDFDGNYSLMSDGKEKNKLVVSFSGFKKETVVVGKKTIINVVLKEDVIELEGAVIVAKRINSGMMNISERDMTSAAVRIDMADLMDFAGAGMDDALQGRIAGVDMVGSSGAPGAGMSIRIRGTTSISGSSQPLIVVDGFPYETTISDDFDFANANEEDYSQMLNIAPSDIQDITVLKDAAATAIWGSRAANGVLQITTKRGSVSKPRVSYSFKGTTRKQGDGIPTLEGDEYVSLIQESMMNAGVKFNPMTYPELANDVNNPYYYYNYGQNTNWFDELIQTGFAQDHNVSISGGDQKAQYRASVGYYDEDGTVKGTGFNRISTRLNVDYRVSDKLQFRASMAYTYSQNDMAYVTYVNRRVDVLSQAFSRAPNMGVHEFNEQGILTDKYFTPMKILQGSWDSSRNGGIYNPVAMANDGTFRLTQHRITPNINVIWRPIEEIRYQLDVGFDVMNELGKAFLPQTATGRPWTEESVNRSSGYDSEAFNMQTFNKLFYTPKLGDNHYLQILLGLSTGQKTEYGYSATTANGASRYLQDPAIPSRVANVAGLGISSSFGESRSLSYFGQVHYGFLDRYIINASLRRDGSSKFGKDYKWGAYPSLSVRYRLSGEPFMRGAEKWLNDLSLRFSYGLNGNQPKGNYASVSTYGVFPFEYLGQIGTVQDNLELLNLRWEKTAQYNFGLNFEAFNGRLVLDFEYYRKQTDDIFWAGLNIPTTTGYSKVDMNVGRMDNEGFELQMHATPVRTKDWVVSFAFNLARNVNHVREMTDLYPQESGSYNTNGQYISLIQKGQPVGSYYGYLYDGVYLNSDQTIARDKNGQKIYTYNEKGERIPVQMRFSYPTVDYAFEPGDARYVDVNNDGNIDYQDIVYLGNAMPLFTGGFGPNVRWKQFSMSAFFNFRYGNDVINQAKMNLENMHGFGNQSKAVLKRFRNAYEDESTAPSDLLPRALYNKGYNYLGSSRFVEDGSFLRFKTLTLKYTFPRKTIEKLQMSDLSLYLTLNNLYCWTNYTGMDPEVTLSNPLKQPGYDNASVPRSREYIVGLNVTF